MKESRFLAAQKAFILTQSADGMPPATCAAKHQRGRLFQLEEKVPIEMRRLKQFEDENNKLKQVFADLSLNKETLR